MAAHTNKKRQINLLPQEEFASSTPGRILQWLLSTFRYLVIATEMIVISAFLSRFYFDSRNADLNDELKQKESYIKAYAEFEQEFRKAQQKLIIYSALASPNNALSPLAQKVVAKLPTDVSLGQLSIGANKMLNIQASSQSERSIEQFIVNLDGDQAFSDVALVQAESRTGSPFLTFTIQANITEGAVN